MVGLLKWLLQTEISGLKFAYGQKAEKPVLRKLLGLSATAIQTTDRYKRDGIEKKRLQKGV